MQNGENRDHKMTKRERQRGDTEKKNSIEGQTQTRETKLMWEETNGKIEKDREGKRMNERSRGGWIISAGSTF